MFPLICFGRLGSLLSLWGVPACGHSARGPTGANCCQPRVAGRPLPSFCLFVFLFGMEINEESTL